MDIKIILLGTAHFRHQNGIFHGFHNFDSSPRGSLSLTPTFLLHRYFHCLPHTVFDEQVN